MSQDPSSPAHLPSATRVRQLAFAVAAIGLTGPACAGDFDIGIGAGVDRGRVDCVASFPCDRSSSHAKLTADYRFAEPWTVQVMYFNAGHFQGGDTTPLGTEFGGTFRVEGLGLTAGYRWTFAPNWRVAGRVGAASVRTRFEYANALTGDVSRTTLQPLAGVGVGYAITPAVRIGVDYDVTRFKVYRTQGSLRMLGVAAQFSF